MPTFTERLYQSAVKAVASRGADVTFSSTSTESHDETVGEGSSSTTNVPGKAVELPADVEEYKARELILGSEITLIFVPTVIGTFPAIGSNVNWAGVVRTVRGVMHYRPQGTTIASKVWVS